MHDYQRFIKHRNVKCKKFTLYEFYITYRLCPERVIRLLRLSNSLFVRMLFFILYSLYTLYTIYTIYTLYSIYSIYNNVNSIVKIDFRAHVYNKVYLLIKL